MLDRNSPARRSGLGGPSAPPDPAAPPTAPGPDRNWFEPLRQSATNEPTQALPVITRRPPPAKGAAARAVIVYQDRLRRPLLLWGFTVVLVALTLGVVLGQAVAFEPSYRSTANAQTAAPAPAPSTPAATPIPLNQPWPDAEHRVTAPLGTIRTRLLEVTGPSTTLRIRSSDLGNTLLDAASIDRSAVPRLTGTTKASRLELIQTGDPGAVGADIQLNTKVAWTIHLVGGSSEQTIDLQAGRLVGLQLAGGTANVVLQLPPPKGTVPLTLTGPVGQLILRTRTGTPIRLHLTAGAETAVLDGKTHHKVKPATTLTTPTYGTTRNRYNLTASAPITSVLTAPS